MPGAVAVHSLRHANELNGLQATTWNCTLLGRPRRRFAHVKRSLGTRTRLRPLAATGLRRFAVNIDSGHGSKDETPPICERLGAKVFHFPWCDDFSAARNESLRHAKGEWIFWMDSDDVIDEVNGRKLRALVESLCSGTPLPLASRHRRLPTPSSFFLPPPSPGTAPGRC